MAKQVVGPVERHVDKAVLGVAALALVYAVARYVVTSPNQVELQGQSVSPDTIDLVVAEKAEAVVDRLRGAQPEDTEYEPKLEELESSIASLRQSGFGAVLPAAAPLHPVVPIVGPPPPREGFIELVEPVKLPPPIATWGRSVMSASGDIGLTDYAPNNEYGEVNVNWVTVSSAFSILEQYELQRKAYGSDRRDVIFAGAQLQRREMLPDGTWSAWEDVSPYYSRTPPSLPEITLVERDGKLSVTTESVGDVERFESAMRAPEIQCELLRPLPPDVKAGSPWKFPLLTSEVDVRRQDNEILSADTSGRTESFERNYGLDLVESEEPTVKEAAPLSPAEQNRIDLQRAEETLQRAENEVSKELALQAYNLFTDVRNRSQPNDSDWRKAVDGQRRAEQLERDIDLGRLKRKTATSAATAQASRGPVLPVQQIWSHDCWPGSVQSGKVYQYRMRFLILNRYAGNPAVLRNRQDAARIFIESEWSEPTEPIYVEPDSQLYAVAPLAEREQVKFEMFRWYEGYWVKNGTARFGIGDTLLETARAQIPLRDGSGVDEPPVPFGTDATIIDIDYDRLFRQRGKSGSEGVKFDRVSSTTAVTFVDAAGRLHERLVDLDRDDPGRKDVSERVWVPPRKKEEPVKPLAPGLGSGRSGGGEGGPARGGQRPPGRGRRPGEGP